ncbi:ankyrin repeat domain-containing protein 13B isoform 1-T1 [Spinachia spinachia]
MMRSTAPRELVTKSPSRPAMQKEEEANYDPRMISAKRTPEKSRYPIHCLVWHGKHRQLEKELATKEQTDLESLDPRGRTPLHLAVTLGLLDCARVLLQHGADVSKENRNGWTVLQEAVSTRDPELVRLVLRYRDYQRTAKRLAGIPVLLERLRQAQDFYVEMKWEFTSWVPLVSRICPSDTYRVWKSGQCLRVDTTLMGFEQMTWQRGRRSFIFRGQEASAQVMEVDHDRQLVFCETLCVSSLAALPAGGGNGDACGGGDGGLGLLGATQPSDEQVAARLSAAVVTTQLDTRNIAFERSDATPTREHEREQDGHSGLEEREDRDRERIRSQGVCRVQRGARHPDQNGPSVRSEQEQDERWEDPPAELPRHRGAAPGAEQRSSGDPDDVSRHDQPRGSDGRGVLQPRRGADAEGHRPPVPAHHQDPEVQSQDVAVRVPSSVPGGAGGADHRPHGHLQHALRQAARLHHSAFAARLPRQDRDPSLPHPERQDHLQQLERLRGRGRRAGRQRRGGRGQRTEGRPEDGQPVPRQRLLQRLQLQLHHVVSGRRHPPVCVRAPAGVLDARRQAERQREGRGGGPAAVRHPAESAGGRLRVRSGDHLGGSDQQQARNTPPPQPAPSPGQDPAAQGPSPLQPRLHPLQEAAGRLQLRPAAAHRHGDLRPGAGRGGASPAARRRRAAAHHPAVTHGEMRRQGGRDGGEGGGGCSVGRFKRKKK